MQINKTILWPRNCQVIYGNQQEQATIRNGMRAGLPDLNGFGWSVADLLPSTKYTMLRCFTPSYQLLEPLSWSRSEEPRS